MAAFALCDAMIKLAARQMPVTQAIAIISAGCLIIFCALTRYKGDRLISSAFFAPAVLARNGAEALGMIAFSTALVMAPFIQVVAISQAAPVLVTLLAVLLLREPVGPRRWAAVLTGLVGVLVMLRPAQGTLTTIDAGALMALLGAFGLALRDVMTRLAPPKTSVLQLATWATATIFAVATGMLAVAGTARALTPATIPLLLIGVAAFSVAYLSITQSVRMAPVSLVIPFRYTRLLFGTALGILLFGEGVAANTALGSLIVVAAGLYIFRREGRTAPLLQRGKGG